MPDDALSFDTLHVASLLTGIGLTEGVKYSDLQRIADQLLGYPIVTHELALDPTMERIREVGFTLFPDMPSAKEAEADYQAAAIKAVEIFGPTITIPKGTDEREADPITTAIEARHAAIARTTGGN